MQTSDDFIGQRQRRLLNLQKLREIGIDPFPAKAQKEHDNQYVKTHYDKFENKEVTLAGRLMSLRNHGKLIFGDIQDQSGRIQIGIKRDELTADKEKSYLDWEQLKLIDSGDYIQVAGTITKTVQGEITIFVKHFRLLTKSLRPLPPHLNDKEEKFRRRYLDLTLNPEQKELFVRKAKFWEVSRRIMKEHGFMEVETPVLEYVTGGADARPFTTHHNELDHDFYLRISTELYQKRLIGAGLEKIYTLGPNFRNEGLSDEHLQEYYQLEWYWAYANYKDNMELTKDMFRQLAKEVWGKTKFSTRGHTFDLNDDWQEIDYYQIIKDRFQIDIFESTNEEIVTVLKKHNIDLPGAINRNRLIDNLWKIIRKTINGPAFLVNHPKFISPLAKSKPENHSLTERFQIIIAGTELGNGYSEINDPLDQLERFVEQQKLREGGDEEAQMLDIDYVEMLEYGMPPVSGYGHSERVFWFLENVTAREGTLFPQLKHEHDEITKKIYQDVMKFETQKSSTKKKQSSAVQAIDAAIRQKAFEIVDKNIANKNLVKHCLCVEVAMKGLANYFGEDESVWGLAGLLHDADWEVHKDRPDLHTQSTIKWMKEAGIDNQQVIQSILAHNYEHNGQEAPKNRMEWALYTCDELTGLIVASALVTPEKKLASVTVPSVMKKFNSKSFAAAVNRNQIRMCEEKLGIKLEDFIQIILESMQKISQELGL